MKNKKSIIKNPLFFGLILIILQLIAGINFNGNFAHDLGNISFGLLGIINIVIGIVNTMKNR